LASFETLACWDHAVKKILIIAALHIVAGIGAALWWSAPVPVGKSSAPIPPASIAIADRNDALTFARSGDSTIVVTHYSSGVVQGVPIGEAGEDAIGLINRLGYDAVLALIDGITETVEIDATSLSMPVNLESQHIAVGTNYPAHAEESEVQDGPFLFPKYVTPTSAHAPIPLGSGLLDYEVELCLVTTGPTPVSDGSQGGLILCNDVTDRAMLLRNLDPDDPTSGEGFTDGKSAPGFLPVGDLYVVPRDLDAFVQGLTLQLSVNGVERQRTAVTNWLWGLDQILIETGQARDRSWAWREGEARLPISEDGIIPARTLILAGTPDGTIFAGIYTRAYPMGLWRFLAGGWSESITRNVIEAQIAHAEARNEYLEQGDQVTIRVDAMGALNNRVE
jgi:2,4-diketo-3-deoxy-L-fuconate hydrolase